MIINNVKIVTLDSVIENGHVVIRNDKIIKISTTPYVGNEDEVIDASSLIMMPGFIDVHIHGSNGVDFMDASKEDIKDIASSLYQEGVTSFLATTLTSDTQSLEKVCKVIKESKEEVPSLVGIHFEGPYISKKYKGAQNEQYIRECSIEEFDYLNNISGNNVKYITLAVENDKAIEFIKHVSNNGVACSVGHSDATFDDVEKAIEAGLTNTTHTHNAMSGHHHRNPGVVSAAMYFDELYTEVILDGVHVCPNTVKTFYKTVGPDRFVIITDALKVKHSSIDEFKLFGLDCVKKQDAAYLCAGPLAGSLLSFDQGVRNLRDFVKNISLIDLMKCSSYNASKSLHLTDRGLIKEGLLADFVLLDESLHVKSVYKAGKKVF